MKLNISQQGGSYSRSTTSSPIVLSDQITSTASSTGVDTPMMYIYTKTYSNMCMHLEAEETWHQHSGFAVFYRSNTFRRNMNLLEVTLLVNLYYM